MPAEIQPRCNPFIFTSPLTRRGILPMRRRVPVYSKPSPMRAWFADTDILCLSTNPAWTGSVYLRLPKCVRLIASAIWVWSVLLVSLPHPNPIPPIPFRDRISERSASRSPARQPSAPYYGTHSHLVKYTSGPYRIATRDLIIPFRYRLLACAGIIGLNMPHACPEPPCLPRNHGFYGVFHG